MTKDIEAELHNCNNKLRSLLKAIQKAIDQNILEPDTLDGLSEIKVKLQKKIYKQIQQVNLLKSQRLGQEKKSAEELKLERLSVFNFNVTIKSDTKIIKKEVVRLRSILSKGKHPWPYDLEKQIKKYEDEINHRFSGIRKKAHFVQGGSPGLKK